MLRIASVVCVIYICYDFYSIYIYINFCSKSVFFFRKLFCFVCMNLSLYANEFRDKRMEILGKY